VIPTAFGLGLVTSLAFSEFLGVAAGGFIVPAYLALSMGDPRLAAGLVAAGAGAFLVVRLVSSFTILYGRRRLVATGLAGIALARVVFVLVAGAGGLPDVVSFEALGYAVPGLIAYWMDRQGAAATLLSTIAAASFVRLVLLALAGGSPIGVPG